MFKRDRDGYFALGLTVGLLSTVLLVIAENHFRQAYDASQYAAQSEQQEPIWWLIPGVMFWEDTVAQWLMMLFTVFAVWLVYRTLIATRETLADTRRIGEAQVRAYLVFDEVRISVSIYDDHIVWRLPVTLRNCGQSPARDVYVSIPLPHDSVQTVRWPDLAANASKIETLEIVAGLDEVKLVDGSLCVYEVVLRVEFRDVFHKGDERTVESATFSAAFEFQEGPTFFLNRTYDKPELRND